PAAPLLEEGDHLRQRRERFHAIAGIVAPARMRPARITFPRARTERDDLGAALGPARAPESNVEREQDVMECAHRRCTPLSQGSPGSRSRGNLRAPCALDDG